VRILVCTTYRGVVGGIETYLRAVLPLLHGRGHELALLYEVPAGGPAIDDRCPTALPAWPASDRAAAARWRPDVCYNHGLSDPGLEAELAAAFPTLLFAHNYHGTCVSGTKRYGFPTARPCARPFGPGCLLHYLPRRCGGLNPLTAVKFYRVAQRRAAVFPDYRAVLVASRHMAAEFRTNGVPAERVKVVPLFPPDCEPDSGPPAPRPFSGRVLMLGRLTVLKGGRLLPLAVRVAADRLGRPLTLVVAGDGPDRPRIERAAARAGVPLEAVGWVGPDRRAELMRAADLLAVPSTWPEPFGLVGVEAGCVGLPAAAFAVGGIPDWLRAGESGEQAPADPPTVSGLADALVRALADEAHWQRLRVGAWETARQFTPDRHVEGLERELAAAAGG